jgi:hypothetical protein
MRTKNHGLCHGFAHFELLTSTFVARREGFSRRRRRQNVAPGFQPGENAGQEREPAQAGDRVEGGYLPVARYAG